MTSRRLASATATAIAATALAGCTANNGAVNFAVWEHCFDESLQSYEFGTTAADRFSGGSGVQRYIGREGNDTIDMGSGDDCAHGAQGDDTVNGGSGNDGLVDFGTDRMNGGSGRDLIVHAGEGEATLLGGSESDVLSSFDSTPGDRLDCGGGTDYYAADEGDIVGANCEEVLAP